MRTRNSGTLASDGCRRGSRLGAALALGAVLALGTPTSAQQLQQLSPLDGQQLYELSLSDGLLLDLELPDRLLGPLALPLLLDGVSHTLVVEPYSVRAPGFRVLVPSNDGLLAATDAPAPRTLRGHVLGFPHSQAAGSLSDGQLQLLLRFDPAGPLWAIQPLRHGGHALYTESAVVSSGGECGTFAPHSGEAGPLDLSGVAPVPVEQVAEIALDADYEYYLKHSKSVDDVVADLEDIIAKTRMIYASAVEISYEITSIIVRTDINDPFTSSSPGTLLGEFRATWNQGTLLSIPRGVAHLFTGRDIDFSVIGVAYLDALCDVFLAYGVSQSRFTTNILERVSLTAHELGHNWASGHCDGAPDCAIMCAVLGGCSGELQQFGEDATSAIVRKRVSVSCLTTEVVAGFPSLKSVFPGFGPQSGGGVLELHGIDLPTDVSPTVTVGGKAAQVLSSSETLVTVAVPAGVPGTRVDVMLADDTHFTMVQSVYRYELEMAMGDKVTSDLGVMEVERFYFEGLAGSRVTVQLRPSSVLDGLIAGLRLIGPGEVELLKVESSLAKKGQAVSFKKFDMTLTGEHRLEAYAIGANRGAYRLKTKLQPLKSVKQIFGVSATDPEPTLSFSAEAGSLLNLANFKRLAPKGNFSELDGVPSDLTPTILGLTGPQGPVAFGDLLFFSPKGAWAKVKKLLLPDTGDYSLRLGALEGSSGFGKMLVKLKPLKKKKQSFVLAP
jgi:hypothetical protein